MTIDEINIPQATSSDFELVCKSTGKAHALADEMLIGQEIDCTIRLKSPQIRRYHAKLNKSEDGLFLEDLNSQNNTYLNGCRIGTGAWVTLGDEINFNGAKFLIKAQSSSRGEHNPRAFTASRPLTPQHKEHAPIPIKHSPLELKLAPEMPFSNQDVVEATRALEARAKERLQLYKQEESILNPDWEAFIDKRQKTERDTSNTKTKINTNTNTNTKINTKTNTETKPSSPTSGAPKNTASTVKAPSHTTTIAATDTPSQHSSSKNNNNHASRSTTLPEIHVPPIEAANDVVSETLAQPATHKNPSTAVSGGDTGNGPRLVVQTAPTRGKCYQLAPTDAKKIWTIGRANHADLRVNEEGIDLIHAHIELADDHYTIRTTRSTNGMLINNTFKSEATLKAGDKIQFGRMAFDFRTDNQSAPVAQPESKHKINYGLLLGSLVVLGALLIALTQSPF